MSNSLARHVEGARPWPVLTILALAGFYVSLDIFAAGGVIPNVVATPFGLMLLVVHLRRISPAFISALSLLVVLYAFNGLWAAIGFGRGPSMLMPAGQILYSVLTVYGVYLDLTLWKKSDLNRLFGVFAFLILLGSALEVFTPFKVVTNRALKMHQFVRSIRQDYSTAFRDLTVFGQVRPKLFTSETSLVAINFGIFGTGWLLTLRSLTARNVMILFGSILAALFVIRSPFTILPLLIGGARFIFEQERTKRRAGFTALELLIFSAVGVAALVGISFLFTQLFGGRVGMAQRGTDWSVIARTYGAIVAGWNVAMAYPIFGAGAGNFEGFQDIMSQTYIGFHVPEWVIRAEFLQRSLNNGLGATLAYFGLLGGAIHVYLWTRILKTLAPATSVGFMLATMFIIYCTAGNIYSPKAVWPLFIIFAAVRAAGALQLETRPASVGASVFRPKRDIWSGSANS